MVCIDILHACDLGITQDTLGNVFWEALRELCPGKNEHERIRHLWQKMKNHYKLFKPPSQLQTLTKEMIKHDKKAPKLRAKGAETRHLVSFGLQLAIEMQEKLGTPHSSTVCQCLSHLMDFYMLISLPKFNAKLAEEASLGFCGLYSALSREAERTGQKAWVMKPKIHMFQEVLNVCLTHLSATQ